MGSVAIITVPPAARGLDFIAAPVSETQLYADRYRFAVLYICRPQDTHIGKVATPDRIRRLHDAGIAVLLNYEAAGNESKYGASKGASDGAWSRAFVESLGYPQQLPILCSSFDTDVRSFLETATAYGEAFANACKPYGFGVYGGTPIIDKLKHVSSLGWKAMASSWSSSWPGNPPIHAVQSIRVYSARADLNTATLPFDAWLPHDSWSPQTTGPISEDIDMRYLSIPYRWHDTNVDPGKPLPAVADFAVPFGGPCSVVVNLTVTDAVSAGFLTAAGAAGQHGQTSAVNWDHPKATVSNTFSGFLPDGNLYISPSCPCRVIVDVQGQL